MTAQTFLSRLNRVRRVGPGRWSASCPTSAHKHGDRSRGLSITEKDDGTVLLRCHAGCSTFEVLSAAGFDDWSELFPERLSDPASPGRSIRHAFIPAQVFDVARLDIGVAAVIASDMHKGRTVTEGDYQRLKVAATRLERIAEAAYGS